VADDDSNAREQWEAINLELMREVTRLVDRNLLSESEKDKIWSAFRSAEERAFAQLYPGRTYSQLSTLERLRAGLRARMWLATVIEGAGTEHKRSVAIRQAIVDLEKNMGVYEKPTLLDARAPTTHASRPTDGDLSGEATQAIIDAIDREYYAKVHDLGEQLRGKVVLDSAAGHSGYMLKFAEGDWVAVWLDPLSARMDFRVGKGDPPSTVTELMSNPAVADASRPLDVDRIYATQPNDIASEAANTHQKQIEGVAIGKQAFSLCFPDGMELEGTVFPNAAGHTMMRVFLEQW